MIATSSNGQAIDNPQQYEGPVQALLRLTDNRSDAAVTHIEESPVAGFLLEWSHELNDWSGTSAELLAQLNGLVQKKVTALRQWPKSPSALARELRRIAP